jgi:histidinol-phosphate phosphatase family protein
METMSFNRPKQAVILAGGRGIRLRPITDTIPKPMIAFHGKPFLEYLICQLKDWDIKEILLLLGYLPETVVRYFGDGKSLGVNIKYSITAVDDDTGLRLRYAKNQIDDLFLFLYCDNYCPLDFNKMWESFCSKNISAQITAYLNTDKYTKDNLRIGSDSIIEKYDKSRTDPELSGVDIGYAIIKKEVLDIIPADNVNFEKVVYPQLVKNRALGTFPTNHRYYSVGNLERLPITEEFLEGKSLIILDRDGVLNQKPPKAQYITKWDEFQWLPGAKKAIRLLNEAKYRVVVVSNQAGIARGMMSETDLNNIHSEMVKELADEGASLEKIYVCPHGLDDHCECRKPKPGMLFAVQRDFHIDLTKTIFIGDDERDVQAGNSAGCKTILVADDDSLLKIVTNEVLKTAIN